MEDKELIMQIAKELALKLMEKLSYSTPNITALNLPDAHGMFTALGDDYKKLVAKVSEAFKTL
jgi:hypothetical protein